MKPDRAPLCFCGKTHALWWGKHVLAPGCKLHTDERLRRDLFHKVLLDIAGETSTPGSVKVVVADE